MSSHNHVHQRFIEMKTLRGLCLRNKTLLQQDKVLFQSPKPLMGPL